MSRTLVLLAVLALPASAAEPLAWPDRYGPLFNGQAPADVAQGLPVEWDQASGQNIAWSVPIPGQGHSTPVVGNGRVWLTTASPEGHKQWLLCLDEKTGEVIHEKLLFENPEPEPLNNTTNTYASPSCVLEPGAVYAHFGTYGTARLDPDSCEVVWERRDIHTRHFRGPGSSPVIFDNLIILTMDGIDKQFVEALDKNTGETVWHTDRSTDYGDLGPDGLPFREGDLRKAYGTPGLTEVAGRTQLISVGSRAAFGYDARTGEEIWTVTHPDYNASARPLFFQDLAIIHTGGGRGGALMGVRLGPDTVGDVTESHVVWKRTRGNSRLSGPVMVGEDRIFMVTDSGVGYLLDAATGDEFWAERIGGNFVATSVVANGLIYCCNEEGETTVLRPGSGPEDEPEVIAQNRLEEGMRASLAVADGALFLRTFGHLTKVAHSEE